MPLDKFRSANRDHWNEAVRVHVASEFYGVNRFLAGESTLLALDHEEVGDVCGKRLLHLQCHFGLDTLSWARSGAEVTGLDFAPAAIEQARTLASQTGLEAEFVEADLYDALVALPGHVGDVDIVYVNVGALCWLPDVVEWARICAAFLREGGILYVRDVHPLAWCIDEDATPGQLLLAYPYFLQSEPVYLEGGVDYADSTASFSNRSTYEWNHHLGEIVTALIEAGLQIQFLHEFDWTVYRALPWMVETEPGVWRLPNGDQRLPLLFSLRALKPG